MLVPTPEAFDQGLGVSRKASCRHRPPPPSAVKGIVGRWRRLPLTPPFNNTTEVSGAEREQKAFSSGNAAAPSAVVKVDRWRCSRSAPGRLSSSAGASVGSFFLRAFFVKETQYNWASSVKGGGGTLAALHSLSVSARPSCRGGVFPHWTPLG